VHLMRYYILEISKDRLSISMTIFFCVVRLDQSGLRILALVLDTFQNKFIWFGS
jgi:hypothetical protein